MQPADDKQTRAAAQKRRPDPVFSYVMNALAKRLKVEPLDTKLPQTLVADSIIGVPEGWDCRK